MSETKIERIPFALLLFELRNVETPDETKIEGAVQEFAKFATAYAEENDLSFGDAVCAALDFTTRIIMAPATMNKATRKECEVLIDQMVANFRGRLLGLLEFLPPSANDGETIQ